MTIEPSLEVGLNAYAEGDYATALEHFTVLAEKGKSQRGKVNAKFFVEGNVDAKFYLVEMYANGDGVPQDYRTAWGWAVEYAYKTGDKMPYTSASPSDPWYYSVIVGAFIDKTRKSRILQGKVNLERNSPN